MSNTATGRSWSRGASQDLWRHTLAQIESLFGRIVYLALLRNATTGRYEHHGLAVTFGQSEAEETLRRSHEEAFAEWLTQPLASQKEDLMKHLAEANEDSRQMVRNWIRMRPYRNWTPATAKARECQLFISDLEVLLEAIRVEFGVAEPDPDA